jgi:hypothetical protein
MQMKNASVARRLRDAGIRRAARAARGHELPLVQTTPLTESSDTPTSAQSAQSKSSHDGTEIFCPLCLVPSEDGVATLGETRRPGEPAASACPDCGVASVEWALTCEIDGLLREMRGFDLLEGALSEEGRSF